MKTIVKSIKLFVLPIIKKSIYKILNLTGIETLLEEFWDEIGKLQFSFLVSQGLKPEHYFLDVGCGSLRGGVQKMIVFIKM